MKSIRHDYYVTHDGQNLASYARSCLTYKTIKQVKRNCFVAGGEVIRFKDAIAGIIDAIVHFNWGRN